MMSDPETGSNLDELYSELILELAKSEKHRKKPSVKAKSQRGVNPSCGDDIVMALEYDDGKIQEIWREAKACAIAEASAEMLAEILTGKNLEQAEEIIQIFLRMLRMEKLTRKELALLGDAQILSSVSRFPSRVKCAGLAWHTVEKILEDIRLNPRHG